MKNLLLIIFGGILLVGCYKKFLPDYEYTTIAFSATTGSATNTGELGRTVVLGEGLQLDFGVYLAGVLNNKKERWAKFVVDPSLLSETSYELLPAEYYSLSNETEFIILPGDFTGKVTIKLDSAKFVNDPNTTQAHYAIPFRLTETSEDSILSTQNTKILVLKYINRYEGFYDQKGTFETFSSDGEEINSGNISNTLQAFTLEQNKIRLDGLNNQRGSDFQMDIDVISDNSVNINYFENPVPPAISNIAPSAQVSTSAVSAWETLTAVNDELPISNSAETPRYGNWPDGESWQWVQYDLSNTFTVNEFRIYWGSDGGGLMPPTDNYLEYRDLATGQLEKIPNSTFGTTLDQFNTISLDNPIITDQIRINLIGDESIGASTSIIEWEVYGLPAPVTPEQAAITDIELLDGHNSYNSEKSEFNLNYKVNYENGNYSIVTTNLKWRNRIRDGVNEWRR